MEFITLTGAGLLVVIGGITIWWRKGKYNPR